MSESTLLYILVTSSRSPHAHEAVPQENGHGLGPSAHDLADGHIFGNLHWSTSVWIRQICLLIRVYASSRSG